MPSSLISDVCRATLLSQLTYAAPAWLGYLNAGELARLESIVKRQGVSFCTRTKRPHWLTYSILYRETEICSVLCCLISRPTPTSCKTYNLRDRSHNRQLTNYQSVVQQEPEMLFILCYLFVDAMNLVLKHDNIHCARIHALCAHPFCCVIVTF